MPTLHSKIQDLASTFAAGVLAAVRSSSLEELLGERGAAAPVKRGPGRPRKALGGTTTGNPGPAVTVKATPKPEGKGNTGRLARRSPTDIEGVIGSIVSALKQAPEGLRSEHLQHVLKLSKKEITRPLGDALAGKKITKKGQKRSTTYFAK